MAKKKSKGRSAVPQARQKVNIRPITPTQRKYVNEIHRNDITFGIGPAGTGKTYLATMAAMLYLTEGAVDKIVVCRPAINAGGEDLGFLPGGITQKMDPYIRPIYDIFGTYWSKATIKDYINTGIIEISPLAYMRGRTFERTFIIADECQNITPEQLLMLLTRLGEGSKMVITGDPVQSDINGRSCFTTAEGILTTVDTISFVQFSYEDIVRHPTVKKILDVWCPKEPVLIRAAL